MAATRCNCVLRDCIFYTPVPDDPEACDCRHTDKRYYPANPCPLYKKQLPAEGMKNLTERFIRKKR